MPEAGFIGQGLHVEGDLRGSGDLVILGSLEGRVHLANALTIEPSGVVRADVSAERVTIRGRATGAVEAKAQIVLEPTAVVEGELRAPSVVIMDGAAFNGAIHMDVGLELETALPRERG